jgi:hypothetical protein
VPNKRTDPRGAYRVNVSAGSDGQSANANASFTVQ